MGICCFLFVMKIQTHKQKNKEGTLLGYLLPGAGYGSRTRLHGLGNIKAGFTLDLLNLKKYSICNSFSVFSNQ